MVFVKDAEFHMKEDGTKADSLGDRTCLCAYEKEDYSGNEYRFRDDPMEENYDYTGLAVQVMGGLVIVGAVTLVSGGVAAAVGAGAGATMIMGATAVGGTTFVAGLAVTDLISRRVSSTEEYMKAALAGSVVGALTGAAKLVPVSGLARVGVDFLAGASGSAADQLITEGEVDAERMFREGVLAVVMAAGARMLRGGDDKLFDYADERLEDIPSSVWNDGSFPRGKRIDKAKAIRNNLGDYFPTVDRLSGKVLSSNKSYDTTLPSYLNAKKWLSTMKRDINKLKNFTEMDWNERLVDETSYDIKRLNIVLPNVELTKAQKAALKSLKAYADTLKIEVKVYITW